MELAIRRQNAKEYEAYDVEVIVQKLFIIRTDIQDNRKSHVWVYAADQSDMQVSISLVVGFGIANRVLYKMALNPLSDYVFFLAQFQTFSYVLVYFGVLAYKRYV